jgi:predicted ATPase/DNA-binding SARP family transcriptional activator
MSQLAITLFGSFQVTVGDELVTDFRADSARALLVYLAMHAETPFQRTSLSTLLWPDQPEAEALHALRQALNRLRSAIGDRKADPPFLHITRTTIQFNPDGNYWLDVGAFKDLIVASRQHPHRSPQVCRSCNRRLIQAAELYRGDLLAGFSLNSPPFEEWLLIEREYLHRQAIDVFYQLAAYHERRGEFETAQHYARRQVELEPWREEAHQQLMRTLALSGQRSAALAQYNTCRQILSSELGIAPTSTTEMLCEQIEAETLEHASQPPHNLPAQLGPFIGRQAQLEQIAEKLDHPECRLLTLVGPGGVGKTRLALQVAWEEVDAFEDGVYFVPLTAVRSPDVLTTALAQALGFSFRPGASPQKQLGDYLKKKQILLILDNFEHLLSGGELIFDLLRHAAGVRILVTSQKRLNVPGEWLFNVEAFDYPDDASTAGVEQYSAVQFFEQSALRWRPDFALTSANRPDVVRICQLVGGIPLALELAASWLRAYSCPEIAQEVQNDMDFLQSSSPSVPVRHHSIRAAFRYSWTLLTDEEKSALQRLTVFHGNFNKEAALRVTDASSHVLIALVDKSMLHRVTEHSASVTRYAMHNLVRHYAMEKLTLDPAAALSAHEQYCDYYCALLQELENDLAGGAQRQALETLSAEIENIRVAWEWAVVHEKIPLIKRTLEGLYQFYSLRYWFQEGESVFDQAIERLSQLKSIPEHVQHVIYRLSVRRGMFLGHLGKYDEAECLLQNSLKGLRALDDIPEIAFCLNCLSFVNNRRGEYAQAKDLLEQALALSRAAQSRQLEAGSLSLLGAVCFYLVDYVKSSDYYAQTLCIRRELGDRFGESLALGNLGIMAYEQNDFESAKTYFEQSLDIVRYEIGNREREGWILNNLGMVAFDYGDYADAGDYYEQALNIGREIGDLWGESNTLGNLGLVQWALGDFSAASDCYATGVQIKQEIGDRRGESMIVGFQSLLAHYLGDDEAALELGLQASAIAQELCDRPVQAYALTFVGHAYVGLEHWAKAADAYHQALAIRREMGQHSQAIEITSGLANVSLLQNDLTQARAHVDEIMQYLENGSLHGALEPFMVYLTCYRVLKANHCHLDAQNILKTAYQLLQACAAKIPSQELRLLFSKIASHAQIVQEWQRMTQ